MAFITPEELETHLYKENIEAISREDETILTAAIDAAIEEAYGYLGAYDRKRIFEATGSQRNALLLIFVKDIAVWHFVNLCNAGCEKKGMTGPWHGSGRFKKAKRLRTSPLSTTTATGNRIPRANISTGAIPGVTNIFNI